jgi:DNA-binding CsgD family transcriptional regulator
MKLCSKCKEPKPDSAYSNCQSAKDGLNHRCDDCNRLVANAYYEKKNGTAKERKLAQEQLLDFIKHLRSAGETLKEIANLTGLDESSISYYLSGKRKVGTKAVKKAQARFALEGSC